MIIHLIFNKFNLSIKSSVNIQKDKLAKVNINNFDQNIVEILDNTLVLCKKSSTIAEKIIT